MQLILKALGDVLENAVLDHDPDLTVGPDEVLVRIEAATINPVDSMLASGNYGYRIEVPFALGSEGVGRVVEGSAELLGRRVLILPNYEQGTWAEQVVVKAANVIPIPDEGDPLQLAMLGINPLTAHLALTKYVDLKPGDWIGQNLGNSAVGQYAAALAKHAGLKVLSVVRRPVALDADAVVVDGGDLAERIEAELGDNRLKLVLDGTGDATVGALAQATEFEGTVVSYSSVTGEPPAIGLGDHIYRQLRLTGLWIVNWLTTAPRAELERTYGDLARLVVDGVLRVRVEATYSLGEYAQALEHARRPGRDGKVLFRP
ncbi:zinc-dependent alcohol dehydrogenase family protein [Kribbella sp. NPDC026596]|uniref:zinc-dependent alcohol dehydrogenase family protein n=1 Tax=Kribbella sp. NPDC026596 TaxID=3155122 RepID=UPI0033D9123A